MSETQNLKGFALLSSMNSDQLSLLAKIAHPKDVIAGDTIFGEGSKATSLYLIKFGTVQITKQAQKETDTHMATLGQGSHFGEMGFIDGMSRAATAFAKENTQLLEIRYDNLEQLLKTEPSIGLNFYRALAETLCKRIRNTNNDLSSLKEIALRHP